MNFETVIAPMSLDLFLGQYVGRQFFVSAGEVGRFRPLVPWNELNATLEGLRVSSSRLSLVRDGRTVNPERYLRHARAEHGSTVRSTDFHRLLRDGATLVLNAVDELFPPVRQVAESFEELFRIPVQLNLYAGWRTQNGFDLHWDDHDTMILQVHGRKHWRVYRPTRLHPLKKDVSASSRPDVKADLAWDGVLADGSILYMPRGWWHVACPLDEPSLHLTVGLSHPTGVHMLSWLVNEMKAHDETRMDVPHLADAAARKIYVQNVSERLQALLDETVVERFMNWWDTKAIPRPVVRLPEAAMGTDLAITLESRLRLAAGSSLHFTPSNGGRTVRFQAHDRPWECPADLVPALLRLGHIRSHTLQELSAELPSEVVPRLKLFVTALAIGNVVEVQQPR
jgi:ribosomal protein L16 Arg81 hydroxylase